MNRHTATRDYFRWGRVCLVFVIVLPTLLATLALTPGISLAAGLTEQLWEAYDGQDLVVLGTTDGRPAITTLDVDTRAEVRAAVEQALAQGKLVEWDAIVAADGGPFANSQWGLESINARSSWSMAAASVVVAVLDTGVNQHEDLIGRLLPGYNALDGTANVSDSHNHGTHVAGIIAANSSNDLGVAGVATNAVILPVKVLGDDGVGTTSSVAAGLIWATDNGARIANLSLAGPGETLVLRQAVEYATSRGVLVVAGAGNDGVDSPTMYPAAYSDVIAVAACDESRNVAAFSSRGSWVDVTAPGVAIASTVGTTGYSYMSGTSMATPHVAAQAAVLVGLYPQRTANEIRSYIETTLVDIDQPGPDVNSGGGLVDIAASIETGISVSSTDALSANSTTLPAVTALELTLQGPYVALRALALTGPDVEGYSITRDGKFLGVFSEPVYLDTAIGLNGTRTYAVRAVSRTGVLGDVSSAAITPTALRQPTIRSALTQRRSVIVSLGPVARGQRVYVYLSGKLVHSTPPSTRAQKRMIVRLGKLPPGTQTLQVQVGTTDALSKLSRSRTVNIKL
jgi:subtilisin family serine protease